MGARGPRTTTGSTRRVRSTAAGVGVLLVAGAVAPQLVQAAPLPQRVLQAVTVDLGTDGSVTGLTSALVSRDEDGSASSSTRLDPAEHADELPVRITTGWKHDGEVGSDLADLEGVDGRVEITVTVQNATVRPERFRYDAGGVARDSSALVATPLTVVASATLPDGSAGDVVRPQPGTSEPGTTNGVLSADGDETTVQWASLLAPPRLSTSTTFTLVQEAEDFALPDFTLSVQPGLATDTSVARLVGNAFGGPGGLVGDENNTIGLIAGINGTLAQVTDSLESVRETLNVNAGEVGTAATARLTGTADAVDAAAAGVLRDLEALEGSVGSTVGSTNDRAVSALQVSVQGVLDYFGTPAEGEPAVRTPACGEDAAAQQPADTLLGQLATVSRQLRELSGASAQCVVDLRASLRATIGDQATCTAPAVPPVVPPVVGPGKGPGAPDDEDEDEPLVCRLLGTSGALVDVAGQLADDRDAAVAELDPAAVADVNVKITGLVTAVTSLQAAGRAVDPSLDEGAIAALLAALDDLEAGLDAAQAAADAASTDGVEAELGALAALAEQRLAELDTDESPEPGAVDSSVRAQLAQLAASVCATVVEPGSEAEAQRDAVRRLVDGLPCSGGPKGATGDAVFVAPLTDRLDAEVQAWEAVLASTDVAAPQVTGAAAALLEVDSGLDAVASSVTALRATLADAVLTVDGPPPAPGTPPSDKPLKTAVRDLVAQLDALYDDRGGELDCADAPAAGAAPLNALAMSFAVVDCNQDTLAETLRAAFDEAAGTVRDAATDEVTTLASDAEGIGAEGDAALDTLSRTLITQLDGAAGAQVEQGQAVVAAQRARLDAVRAAAAQELDQTAQDAVARLSDQISRAGSSQAAASAALQAQLQKVLLDLGSAKDGQGLLGVIQNSAGQTGVRTEQVQQAARTAASFRGVRLAELADAQLERQQLTRSLQSAQQFGTFVEQLPAGSTSSTVFVVRIGGR